MVVVVVVVVGLRPFLGVFLLFLPSFLLCLVCCLGGLPDFEVGGGGGGRSEQGGFVGYGG